MTPKTLPIHSALHDEVVSQRETIDDIDIQIIELLKRRRNHSISVQAAKVTAGLPRVDVARELVVIQKYKSALDDIRVPEAIISYCKN